MIGSKEKQYRSEIAAFLKLLAWGCHHSRRLVLQLFAGQILEANIQSMISFYNSEVERFQSEKLGNDKDTINRFINNNPGKISWSRASQG